LRFTQNFAPLISNKPDLILFYFWIWIIVENFAHVARKIIKSLKTNRLEISLNDNTIFLVDRWGVGTQNFRQEEIRNNLTKELKNNFSF